MFPPHTKRSLKCSNAFVTQHPQFLADPEMIMNARDNFGGSASNRACLGVRLKEESLKWRDPVERRQLSFSTAGRGHPVCSPLTLPSARERESEWQNRSALTVTLSLTAPLGERQHRPQRWVSHFSFQKIILSCLKTRRYGARHPLTCLNLWNHKNNIVLLLHIQWSAPSLKNGLNGWHDNSLEGD